MKPKILYVGIASLLFVVIAIVVWFSSQKEEVPPVERLALALELLEDSSENSQSNRRKAQKIALELKAIDFHEPGKPNYMYILGVAAFRDAIERVEDGRSAYFQKAIDYLVKSHTVDSGSPKRQAKVNYMLGVSYYYLDDLESALDELKLAKGVSEETRGVTYYLMASILLADGEVVPKDGSQGAAELNLLALKFYENLAESGVLVEGGEGLSAGILNKLYLQKIRIHLQLAKYHNKKKLSELAENNHDVAKLALKNLSKKVMDTGQAKLLEVQLLMSMKEYRDAFVMVETLVSDNIEEDTKRMAKYLRSLCLERMGETDKAIQSYKEIASEYEEDDEGIASNILLARLLMSVERDEEAITSFENALKVVRKKSGYSNRWVSKKEASQILNQAWKQWVDEGEFDSAVDLSGYLYPLFSKTQTAEYKARVLQKKAEKFKSDRFWKTALEQKILEKEYQRLWSQSGEAYADLAKALKRTSDYTDALWVSVEHFKEGGNVDRALEQVDEFIVSESRKALPKALLMRGKLLMDKGRHQDAIVEFTRIIGEFSTDSGVFESQYLIGVAYREVDDLEKAEQVWREVLTSSELTPNAKEWRHSVYSLAELLFNSAVMMGYQANSLISPLGDEEKKAVLQESFGKYEEASRLFSEYLERYERSDTSDQAQFYLAKSLQYYSEAPKLELVNAETENAELELNNKRRKLLKAASENYRELIDSLVIRYEEEQLDEISVQIYKDSHFLYARTLFQLGELGGMRGGESEEYYNAAINAFNSASTRFSDDPQVLLAYVQVALCYQNLGNPGEARGVLSQASVIREAFDDMEFQDSKGSNYTLGEWKNWLNKIRQAKGFTPVESGQAVLQ